MPEQNKFSRGTFLCLDSMQDVLRKKLKGNTLVIFSINLFTTGGFMFATVSGYFRMDKIKFAYESYFGEDKIKFSYKEIRFI